MKTLLCLFLLFTPHADANTWIPDYVPVSTRLAEAAPHALVYDTGGRPIVIIYSKMPCEAVSGNASPPGDVLRWVANTFASLVNESAVVGFDVEFVCKGEM